VCFVDNTANYNTLVYLNYPCPTVADITLPSAAFSPYASLLADDLSGLNSTDAVPVFRLSLKSAALPPCYAVSNPTGVRTAYFQAPIAQWQADAADLYVQTSSANMTGVAFPTTAEAYIYPFMYAGGSPSANPATFTLADAAGVMTLSCLFTHPNVSTSPMQVAISITSYVPTASPPHSGGGAGSGSSHPAKKNSGGGSSASSSAHASSSHAHGQSQSHVDSSSVVVAPSNRATNAQSKLSTGAIAGIVAGVVVVVVLVIGVVMWRTSVSKKEKRRLTPSTSTS
jgi:hypothetical protein